MGDDALGEVQRAAQECEVPVCRVSLGPVPLLGSHACVAGLLLKELSFKLQGSIVNNMVSLLFMTI